MVVVWVKHAPKEYANKKGPADKPFFDPNCIFLEKLVLCKIYENTVNIIFREIISNPFAKHHIKIVSSPFARTRQTANHLKTFLEEKASSFDNQNIKITIEPVDVGICEYLGNQKSVNHPLSSKEFYKETLFYQNTVTSISDKAERAAFPYLNETVKHLEERCLNHLKKVYSEIGQFEKSGDIPHRQIHRVFVSHGFVIMKIMQIYFKLTNGEDFSNKLFFGKSFEPLEGFAVFNSTFGEVERF
jgi:hypothetical protein